MSVSSIDKLPGIPATVAPGDREAVAVVGALSPQAAPIDPHSVLALDAWPASGPRLFERPSAGSEPPPRAATGDISAADDLDSVAAHIVAFLT